MTSFRRPLLGGIATHNAEYSVFCTTCLKSQCLSGRALGELPIICRLSNKNKEAQSFGTNFSNLYSIMSTLVQFSVLPGTHL
ncbi:unnamed protein product [Ixodes pacificus]